MENKHAALVLSDGTIFRGSGFGAPATKAGELVFNTSMTGYQEALTDPSYAGQILTFTYPLVGNYGITNDDFESNRVWAEGFVVREACVTPVHSQSVRPLGKFLEDEGIPGITGLDTRSIVRKIREAGVMPAALQVAEKERDIDADSLLEKARALDYSKINFVEIVSRKRAEIHGSGNKTCVLVDCGVKMGIVRELNKRSIKVVILPYNSTPDEILSFSPNGIVYSNGPGDPALMKKESEGMRKLFDYPIFGICLGCQLLGQAAGASTYKLKFGHRGANQPVLDRLLGKIAITTQNHGYAVAEKGLGGDFEVTHVNCNDNTVEGIAHKSLPIFSVQYHPEANPGPQDSTYLFDKFAKLMK